MFNNQLNKKYLDEWERFVVPYIKIKDFTSARYEADRIMAQLTDELGYRKLSYKFWRLTS